MNPETFFDNFGMLADVPDGVKKLRELILQLAVQGKLVAQDANDEPAAVQIQRLKKEKLVSKAKGILPINAEELPFELPQSWEWVPFRHIVEFNIGRTPKTSASEYWSNNGIPWVSIADMQHYGVISKTKKTVSQRAAKEVFRVSPVPAETILMSFKLTIGKISILGIDAYHNEAIISIHPAFPESKDFLFRVLPQVALWGKINGAIKGKTLNSGSLTNLLIPLPPLNEQHRIVEKVDQLMALCDELEARQKKKYETRMRLNSAALSKLTSAPDGFIKHWQSISDNFDLLYDAPETMGELRKAILQLAVMGKLVAQDETDEPASVLVEKIRGEKERLVKEGKIRKQKAVPPIEGSDGLFELPESWQWDRFANVTLSSEAGWSPQCETREREGNEWGVLKISAVSWDVFKPHENKALPSRLEPRSQHEVKVGDFLLSRANTLELVAKSVVVEDSPPKLMMSDKLIRLHLSENLERRFFNIFNNCSTARGYYAKEASGTSSSMRNVSRECIMKMPVPVPPVEEQRRIVARVDQLMTLCDELEAKLARQQKDGAGLMEAAVGELVAG